MKKIAVLSATIAAAAASFSAHGADKVTFDEHILPIFRNACLNCHNPDKKKAGLDLSTYQATLQGSENGKVVQSGNAANSLLFKCVKQTEDPKMPPKGDKLNDADLSLVEKWIAGQLLENASGKGIAVAANNVQVAVVSLERPAGPPPMPGDLPLEPYVRTKSTNALTALAISPWAPLAAIGGQKQVLLYNTETLQPLGVLPFPEGFPSIIRFSRNGQLLLTGGGLGGKSGKVVLWDIKTGERIATIGNEFDQVLAADLSADQQFVALGGPTKMLKIYSTKDGKLLHSVKKHTDWITAIAYSPDGKYLASADRNGGIQIWEGSTGKEFNSLPGHKAMVTGLAFMPGVLASSSEDGKIVLWDAKEGKEIRNWAAHPGGAEWVDFTPDGRLVSCGRDKIAKVWDQNGKALGKTEAMGDIALRSGLANDRVIAGDWTGRIIVTSIEGKLLGELSSNPPSLAERIAATAKNLADSQSALPLLQQQVPAAEEKLKAEQLAADTKRKDALTTAETNRNNAQKALETAKNAAPQIEQKLAELRNSQPAAQKILAEVKTAADAAAKVPEEKKKASAPAEEIEAAQKEATAKATARDEAQKQLEALQAQITATANEAIKLRNDQSARVGAADKALQATAAQLAELQKPPAPVPAVVAAEQELAKVKAALDETTAKLAASKEETERWKVAQVYQNAHDARRNLTAKENLYAQLVQTAKDAPGILERARNDLAAAKQTSSEGPKKIADAEKAFADAREKVTAAKQAVATAETAVPDKDKAAKAAIEAAPPVGNVAEINKKIAELNADVVKLRDARGAFTAGTPEYADANKKLADKRAEVAKAQQEASAAGAKNLEVPEVKTAQAELDKAKETVDTAKRALKTALQSSTTTEKATVTVKKEIEAATQVATRLEKDLPQIAQDSERQKAQAETAAAAAAKEVEAAKAEVEKRRAAYETLKNGAPKAAALTPVKAEQVAVK